MNRLLILGLTLLIALSTTATPQYPSITRTMEEATVRLNISTRIIEYQIDYIHWLDDCLRVSKEDEEQHHCLARIVRLGKRLDAITVEIDAADKLYLHATKP